MARKLRLEYPGSIFRVMDRSDRREPIFRDDRDRVLFLDTFTAATEKTGWQAHALCLMPNSCPTIFIWWWKPPVPTWWPA
jgi:hypothetical protein